MATSRPQIARFEKPLAPLRALFRADRVAASAVDATIDEAVKTDARGKLFALEGLLRLYDGIYGRPLASMLEAIKGAEDAFGKHGERVEYLEYAKKVGAPAAALAPLQQAADETRAHLREALPRLTPALDRLSVLLYELPWQEEAEDARRVMRELADELEELEELKVDCNDLQRGVHELRRDLRWFLIDLQALDGLVVLDPPGTMPLKLNCYSYLATHPIASHPFSRVDTNPSLRWISSVPASYFLALGKIVTELGDVKTFAEDVEALAHALLASGEARTAALAHARALELAAAAGKKIVPDVPEAAERLVEELKETKLLRRIRRAIKDNLRAVPTTNGAGATKVVAGHA
jgi:hypothetical protein